MATVIVAYESSAELPGTLAALRAQLEPGDELVVVDNASSDASGAVARAAGATVLELERNVGFAGGCQAGAGATSAPLLFFLNPDCVPAPGALAALRAAAAERPDWGAWQALVTLEGGEQVNTSGGVTHWLGMGWAGQVGAPVAAAGEALRDVSFASGAALAVRREAWEAVGGFDPEYFMYSEDLDLSLRLRLAGWGVGIAPAARVEHAYDFDKGAYKWFLLERNRWWTVLGAYPTRLLVPLLPALLGAELALLVVAARGGWLREKLRAQAAVLRSLPWALRRRRRVQAQRRVPVRVFAGGLSATLDSPFLGPVAELAPVRTLQAAYWGLVRRLVRV
ncbi:glycosyltransferase family 2 protein [Solirubrobacter deserti]|uniref:glycosyltransferase family 2 protein n=1 Tax=Solirubrobacter deserti TaxID=2282478 RepID=UPI0022CD77B3|nr:glycosyltransferase [Solirubrobacter deserti]